MFFLRVSEAVVEICEEVVVQLQFPPLRASLEGEMGELERLRVALLSLQVGQCEDQVGSG